jgi:Flp pilus assembly protein TadG
MLASVFSGLGRRASVSAEFALTAVFFLLPLFGGSVDMVEYISAKAQLNTALQALYYYALTTPSAATTQADTAAVVALMSSSLHPVTLTSSSLAYDCIATTSTTVNYVATSPANTDGKCTNSQTQRTRVSYSVSSRVFLSVPMPFVSANPLTITSSGTVQVR